MYIYLETISLLLRWYFLSHQHEKSKITSNQKVSLIPIYLIIFKLLNDCIFNNDHALLLITYTI